METQRGKNIVSKKEIQSRRSKGEIQNITAFTQQLESGKPQVVR